MPLPFSAINAGDVGRGESGKGAPARPGGRICPTARQYLSRSSVNAELHLLGCDPDSIIYQQLSPAPANLLTRNILNNGIEYRYTRQRHLLEELRHIPSSIAASPCSCKHERTRQVCAALSWSSLLPSSKYLFGHLSRATPPSPSLHFASPNPAA
jgi:hypothetical protein